MGSMLPYIAAPWIRHGLLWYFTCDIYFVVTIVKHLEMTWSLSNYWNNLQVLGIPHDLRKPLTGDVWFVWWSAATLNLPMPFRADQDWQLSVAFFALLVTLGVRVKMKGANYLNLVKIYIQYIYIYIYMYVHVYLHLCIYVILHLSIWICMYFILSIYWSDLILSYLILFYLSILSISINIYLSLSIYKYIYIYIYPSIYLFIYLSI